MKLFHTIILFCISVFSSAQSYRFRHLTTAEGLLSDLRLVMTEDRQGRLWIGSDEGINVFDGYQVSSFNQPDNVFEGSGSVLQIYCDKQGTLWAATPLGVFFKEDHDNRFHKLPYENELMADGIFFGENSEGQVLIASRNNLFAASAGKVSERLSGFDELFAFNKSLVSFSQFMGDEWLMAFRSAMFLVNVKTQKVIRQINTFNTWCTARVNDSTILAGSFAHDTLSMVNMHTGESSQINHWPTTDGKPIPGFAGSIESLGNGKFAIACRYSGVYLLDMDKQEGTGIQHDPGNPASLKGNNCRRLMVTRNGTLFVHTRGLSFTQLSKPLFSSQSYLVSRQGERYDAGFATIVQNRKGNYWIGTNRHLALWDREKNLSTFFPYADSNSGSQKFRTIRTVVVDRLDRVWVGTFGGGIGMLKPGGSFEQVKSNFRDSEHSIPSNEINAITKDGNQDFLICANNGFAHFDPVAGKVKRFSTDPVLGEIASQTTFYILADKRESWWIAQTGGLFFFDRHINKLFRIPLPGKQKSIQTQVVATDSAGIIYAGGLNGLYIISPVTRKVSKFLTRSDGLTSNNIVGLLCDRQGMMWILGNIGVSRYDPKTGKLESFDVRDGIDQSNHTLCNFYMSPEGEVFFTSSNGFNYFIPEKIRSVKRPLKVLITAIEFKDSTITSPEKSKYFFRHDQNNISFSFFAVDFQFGPSIQYRYRLQKFDKAFIYAGKERTARYTNLAPGNYSFSVEASLNGSDWFSLATPINISVAKAFWNTWWFIGLLVALAGLILFWIFSSRINKVKREESIKRDFENQLAQVRMNLLRTQMNPHFLFNSLNSINSFILKNDRQNASGYLTKFSRLMRLILDNSRNEWVTLESELKAIELYIQLESLRFNHSFGYHINITAGTATENIILPPMLIQPYIENAIWHGLMYRTGPGGMLTVEIIEEEAVVVVCIKDNGVGRAAAATLKSKSALQQKSYGMKITSERMRIVNMAYQINAQVVVNDRVSENGNAAGTEVVLTLKKIVQQQNM